MGRKVQFDEAFWNYLGWAWSEHGVPPYTGTLENKTPGIFIVYALTQRIFGGGNVLIPRLLAIAAQVTTCGIIFRWVERIQGRTSAAFSAFFFACATAHSVVNGPDPSYTETYLNLFTVVSLFLMFPRNRSSAGSREIYFAGLSMGAAIAFKQVALFPAVALWLLAGLQARNTPAPIREWVRSTCFLATGILTTTFCSLVPLWVSGVSTAEYVSEAWLILLEHGGGGAPLSIRVDRVLLRIDPRTICAIVLFMGVCFWTRFWATMKGLHLWLAVWLLLEIIAVNTSGYYWWHQFKQLLPALAVILGLSLGGWNFLTNPSKYQNARTVSVLLVWICLFLPYGQSFGRYKGEESTGTKDTRELGEWIQKHTQAGDIILCHGSKSIYLLMYSRRCSSIRDVAGMFAYREGMASEWKAEVLENPPKLIVLKGRAELPVSVRAYVADSYSERSPQPANLKGYRLLWRKDTEEITL